MPHEQINLLASSRPLINNQGENVGANNLYQGHVGSKRLVYLTGPQLNTLATYWNQRGIEKYWIWENCG